MTSSYADFEQDLSNPKLRLGFALDYYDPRLVEMSQLVMGRDYYSCPLRKNFLICAILFFLDKMRGNYRPVVGIAAGRPHHDYYYSHYL